MGKQKYSAYIILVGNWVVTIPLAAIWVFGFEKGIVYVWGMKTLGSFTALLGHIAVVIRTNWDKMIADSLDRLDKAKKST